MLELAGDFDAFLCGDDGITRAVLKKSLPRLKVVSKYGVGLDKVDVTAATELRLPVCFCPGVNHGTVAEHAMMLMLALAKNLAGAVEATRKGNWKRQTGYELLGKTLGIVGLGRVGKEVALRARAFGMKLVGFDKFWDQAFADANRVQRTATLAELLTVSDFVSLHTNLTPETREMINADAIAQMKPGVFLVNCARGEIVNVPDLVAALDSRRVAGYGADVLEVEPPPATHPLLHRSNCIVTPHIASRTQENVIRQATMAVENLIAVLEGRPPVAQANSFP